MSYQPYIGTIMLFAGNFAPQGWAQCNGQLLSISENDALFSLIGTTYGGDGQSTFALPDLRGRAPLHQGQGPGLSNYTMGANGGVEDVRLATSQLPTHSHRAMGNSSAGTNTSPAGGVWATSTMDIYGEAASANTLMSQAAVSATGGGQSHDNMLPFTALNFCIALVGLWPSQS